MKKMLAVVAAVMMTATAVFAAPATPVFNKPVTLGEGSINNWLNKRMVFSGSTVYVGFAGADGAVRVAKSDNGGLSWGSPQILQAPSPAVSPDAASVRLAISNDPLYTGQKIVHAMWHVFDTDRIIIYYSYNTNRPKLTGWSTPARIDLGSVNETGGLGGASLAVTNSGAIHILYNKRYITAASFDSSFSSPVSLPGTENGATYMVMDSNNNLYATYVVGGRSLKMTKREASSSAWSPPITVHETSLEGLSGNHDLVVLSPTTYYVGIYYGYAAKGDATLLTTTDGGGTWTKRSIYTNETDGDNCINVAVSSTGVISFASEIYDAGGSSVIKVWRSNDKGATWSAPATVKGQKLPNISLDSAGKLNLLVMDEAGKLPNSKLLWIKEK